MADSIILYEIVAASFLSLTGLLFWIRRRYYKNRSTKNNVDAKSKISWMKSGL
ncbi:MAG TPA: hypothetical protein VIA09_00465 [Nitrososphaeraceae archaeon]